MPDDVAVVTGATGGIGRAVVDALLARGDRVVLTDRDAGVLAEAAGELRAAGHGDAVAIVAADVAEPDAAARVTEAATGRFGAPTVLVNNAGVCRDARIGDVDDALWDEMLDVNLTATMRFCRAVSGGMRAAGYGRIVNVTSRALLGGFGQAAYSAAKGGLVSLTRSLALELARDGVTVNAVAPGTIDTPMYRAFRDDVRARLAKQPPAGRVGRPEEVAAAICFLASREASYVTGQTLHVCGGKSVSSVAW